MPSPLPVKNGQNPIVFHGFRVLTLEDGTTVHGCGECPDSTDHTGTLGDIRAHRRQVHSMNVGGAKKKAVDLPGMVPLSVRMMPLGELLDMAGQLESLGDLIAVLTSERDDYKQRALNAEIQVRRWERTFATLGLVPKETD